MSEDQLIAEWKESIETFTIGDIRKLLGSNYLETGLVICSLIGVDCLGAYYKGLDGSTKSSFLDFLEAYFPQNYLPYKEKIWELRCTLVHDYALKKAGKETFMLTGDSSYPHLMPSLYRNLVWFNRETFAKNLLGAWESFRKDVDSSEELQKNVISRIRFRGYLVVRNLSEPPKVINNGEGLSLKAGLVTAADISNVGSKPMDETYLTNSNNSNEYLRGTLTHDNYVVRKWINGDPNVSD